MRTREAAADVIGGIYEAALEPARWPEALGRMAGHLEATSAAAFVVDLSASAVGFMAVSGVDPQVLAEYGAHYARIDPWNAFLSARPAGRTIVSQAVMDDATFARTEFCNDFLRRYAMFHAMGGFVVRSGSLAFLTGVQRPRERGGFAPAELERMKAVFPHLARAARIHRQLAQAGGIANGLTTALDRVPLAALLCDRTGRVVWMNNVAEALVRRGEGLRVRQGRLEAAVANGTTAELRRLIAAAALIGLHTPRRRIVAAEARDGAIDINNAGGVLTLPRPWPLKPLTVMVTPLSEPAQPMDIALDLPRPEALLLISDPERAVQLPTARLTHAFGLTAAEAKLAAALATGSSLTAYAETAQITIGTARWYLKQALAKTGAHRQSELVRNVITTVGAMEVRAGTGMEAR
jgi:DNA-binding CsgD family transcriptional regulator/PAS domain-containing protein